ncbi:hypothetical protein LFM09_18880 [Lentzea alba]|uniref:hypothetical protein n=1 Tax=Lentzea alba TaxID=2714351 RepID=UPI0039BFD1E4
MTAASLPAKRSNQAEWRERHRPDTSPGIRVTVLLFATTSARTDYAKAGGQMPSMRDAEDNWRKIPYTTKRKLRVISFNEDKVDVKYSGNGAWVYLEGMVVTLDKEYDAHITVTKSPVGDLRTDSDPWELCHLTLTRAHNNHVFYKWNEREQNFTTTSEVLDQKGKHRSAKDHFGIEESQINDPKLVSAIKDDMAVIFLNLV